jgi:hypothetical protein
MSNDRLDSAGDEGDTPDGSVVRHESLLDIESHKRVEEVESSK